MKYLIMTEGTCEKAFLEVLLEKNILLYGLEELLYEEIFKERQLTLSLIAKINQLPPGEKIKIIRVGDKFSDDLIIPAELEERIVSVEKVCIKPEFEILYIILKNEYERYNKQKSNNKPCEYIHSIMDGYKKRYDYNYDFFSKLPDREIELLIERYDKKRLRSHKQCEKSISSIIKNKKVR